MDDEVVEIAIHRSPDEVEDVISRVIATPGFEAAARSFSRKVTACPEGQWATIKAPTG